MSAGMMLLAGCFQWNAPETVTVGGKGEGESKKITKPAAYIMAEDVAREEGQNPKNFNMTDQKTDDAWWILFDHKITGYKLGWPYHFAVRVTLDGKATLYRSK